MITHHPDEDFQFEYSTGSLAEPFALAIASHVALCDFCSAHLEELNTLGGAMLEEIQPIPLSEQALESALMAIKDDQNQSELAESNFDSQTLEVIPEPLHGYLTHNFSNIPWHHVSGGMEELRLSVSTSGYRVSLVRLAPGCKIPTHTHTKDELTVVLSGGYSDGEAHFERGDFCHLDSHVTHNPVADPEEGCIALGVLSGPIELTGWMGTLMNPLLRF